MIGLIFAVKHFCVALILLGAHFSLLSWRIIAVTAILEISFALVFNDRFLSFIDIAAAIHLLLLLVISGNVFSYIFAGYFAYKALISL